MRADRQKRALLTLIQWLCGAPERPSQLAFQPTLISMLMDRLGLYLELSLKYRALLEGPDLILVVGLYRCRVFPRLLNNPDKMLQLFHFRLQLLRVCSIMG